MDTEMTERKRIHNYLMSFGFKYNNVNADFCEEFIYDEYCIELGFYVLYYFKVNDILKVKKSVSANHTNDCLMLYEIKNNKDFQKFLRKFKVDLLLK